jgi:hypothetical protein
MTTEQQLAQMNAEQFEEWKAANAASFSGLPVANILGAPVYVDRASSRPSSPQPRPAAEVWAVTEFDFTCPSGAQCRMQKVPVEELLRRGIIDKVTRLPGITQDLIDKAEGLPPVKMEQLPDAQTVDVMVELVNVVVPLAVVQPRVRELPPENQERVRGEIYVDSIDLEDRIAILNRALQGVASFDSFRAEPGEPR